jgi:hypothetical protein
MVPLSLSTGDNPQPLAVGHVRRPPRRKIGKTRAAAVARGSSRHGQSAESRATRSSSRISEANFTASLASR